MLFFLANTNPCQSWRKHIQIDTWWQITLESEEAQSYAKSKVWQAFWFYCQLLAKILFDRWEQFVFSDIHEWDMQTLNYRYCGEIHFS